jgi:hypothetical protein
MAASWFEMLGQGIPLPRSLLRIYLHLGPRAYFAGLFFWNPVDADRRRAPTARSTP